MLKNVGVTVWVDGKTEVSYIINEMSYEDADALEAKLKEQYPNQLVLVQELE